MNAIALLAGFLFKLTDELFDTQNKYLLEYSEYIKTGCIVFMTLFFFLNPECSLLVILAYIPICYLLNQIDTEFWFTMIPIPFITLTLTVQNLKYIGFTDLLEKIMILVLFISLKLFESKLFIEETSKEKIIFRASTVGISVVATFISQYFQQPSFPIVLLYALGIGYYGTSVFVKTFLTEEPSSDSLSHSGESNTYTYETS